MSSREMNWREVGLAALGACLLAIVMTWPLIWHLGSTVPRDIGDPLAEAWQPAWGGHALLHQPLHFFDANRFWPTKYSLAFGDALIGYAPAGLIGSGPHAAMVRYDLLFIFAYALAFFGAYLLARELGLGPVGAVIAGAAFAYAPYRLEQDGHLQVISSGGIPLAAAFAVRGIRRRSHWWIFWAWIVAAWQLSIGWALGLPFAYGIAGAVLIGVIAWLVRGRPPVPRRMIVAGSRRRDRLHAVLVLDRARVSLHRGPLPGVEAQPARGRGLLGAAQGVPHGTGGELRLGRTPPPASATPSRPGRRRRSSRGR